METVDLRKCFPVMNGGDGVILSKRGDITVEWELELPPAFRCNEEKYDSLVATLRSAVTLLPDWSIVNKQDVFMRKDLYVNEKPFLSVIAELLKRGVDVRLIHAKEPGPIFREEFDKFPILIKKLDRILCPRVHFKLMIFDYREVYVGSANLTGAGIGMKSLSRRNFEAGILTDEFKIVDAACNHFDSVWTGSCCKLWKQSQCAQ